MALGACGGGGGGTIKRQDSLVTPLAMVGCLLWKGGLLGVGWEAGGQQSDGEC